MTHTWHDISFTNEADKNKYTTLNCVIEIPQGSKAKYEIDKETGLLRLDRILKTAMRYPHNYGFIPQTLCDDQDALDVILFTQVTLQPLSILNIKPIGVMHMIDGGEQDDKIIAVASNDSQYDHINDLKDLNPVILDEIKLFFEDYKKLEKKKVSVTNFADTQQAWHVIKQSIKDYTEKY